MLSEPKGSDVMILESHIPVGLRFPVLFRMEGVMCLISQGMFKYFCRIEIRAYEWTGTFSSQLTCFSGISITSAWREAFYTYENFAVQYLVPFNHINSFGRDCKRAYCKACFWYNRPSSSCTCIKYFAAPL